MKKTARFRCLAEQMARTYERKNKDYGDSFGQSFTEHGAIAGIVRIGDKYNRAKQLLLHNEQASVKNESIVDTLLDMASYAIMLAMEVLPNDEE